MARDTTGGGSRSKKPSVGQQRLLREIKKAEARKQLGTIKGIAGIVGGAVLEGIGGPKARGAKTVAKIVAKDSPKVIRAIAREAAGKSAKAPHGIYRKPSVSKPPRLREVDGKPKNVTVRQQVGPKTKSGKFTEPKRKPTTNTQPPARTKVGKPKPLLPDVTKFKGRTIAINKRSANPRIRKRQEAQLRIARREFEAERQRQAKLALRRKNNSLAEPDSLRPAQPTIESRLRSGAEKLDVTSRNASNPGQLGPGEWRKYAQLTRESAAKSPNVTKAQIARGRDRALMSDKARRDKWLNEQRTRIVAKAKAKGMTDTQIQQAITRARAEAAAIARKAAK